MNLLARNGPPPRQLRTYTFVGAALACPVALLAYAALTPLLTARAQTAPPADSPAQTQELAERLLSSVEPGGRAPQQVRLYPGAVPEGLPVRVPVPPGGRLVGTVTRQGEAKLSPAGTEVVVDAPGDPADAVAHAAEQLAAQGWAAVPPAAHRSGFVDALPRPTSLTFCKGATGPWLSVTAMPRSAAAPPAADVRVFLPRDPGAGSCPTLAPQRELKPGNVVGRMPALVAPPDARLESFGATGSAQFRMTSDASATTTSSGAALERHFAQQLSAAGWTRVGGESGGLVAWSAWKLPEGDEWHGLLVVQELPGTNRRALHARVEASSSLPGVPPRVGSGAPQDRAIAPLPPPQGQTQPLPPPAGWDAGWDTAVATKEAARATEVGGTPGR